MERFDRRRFLVLGAKTTAAAAGTLALVHGAEGTTPADAASGQGALPAGTPQRPIGLTTTGVEGPVGVDPDDVQFAWRLADPRRAAGQRGYRITVTGAGGGTRAGSVVWDSGRVTSPAQAFVDYQGPRLDPAASYRWTVRTADADGHWGPASAPAVFTTGLRTGDWSASWLRPGPADPGEEEYTYLRTRWSLPVGHLVLATAFVAAAHSYQLWVNGSQRAAGPSFCFPDEQYVQATDVTAALQAGSDNAVGVLHHWYGPGRGRPTSAPGLLVQIVAHFEGDVRRPHLRWGLASPARRVAPRTAAQQRRRRLRGVDRCPTAPRRMVERRLR